MDNTFDMSDIGIDIDELNRTWQNPETKDKPLGVSYLKDTTPEKQAAYELMVKKHSIRMTTYVVIIAVSIILVLISSMLNRAEAGQALMWFNVAIVTEKTIVVVDEYDTFLTFNKMDITPDLKKGDEVMVVTDLKMVNGKWEMNRSRTAILDIVQ